jgi:hypothetical protein
MRFHPSMRKRLTELILEYGIIFILVHYLIFGIVIVGAWFALRAGWTPGSMTGEAGSWLAAYLVAKVLQVPRIAVSAALTPVAARAYERVVGKKPPSFATRPPASPVLPDNGGQSRATDARS